MHSQRTNIYAINTLFFICFYHSQSRVSEQIAFKDYVKLVSSTLKQSHLIRNVKNEIFSILLLQICNNRNSTTHLHWYNLYLTKMKNSCTCLITYGVRFYEEEAIQNGQRRWEFRRSVLVKEVKIIFRELTLYRVAFERDRRFNQLKKFVFAWETLRRCLGYVILNEDHTMTFKVLSITYGNSAINTKHLY